MRKQEILERLRPSGALGIIRVQTSSDLVRVAEACGRWAGRSSGGRNTRSRSWTGWGAGDSFTGGFLYGYLTEGPQAGVNYGVAVSALKQTNPGDLCWASREEVERLLQGAGLRIVR